MKLKSRVFLLWTYHTTSSCEATAVIRKFPTDVTPAQAGVHDVINTPNPSFLRRQESIHPRRKTEGILLRIRVTFPVISIAFRENALWIPAFAGMTMSGNFRDDGIHSKKTCTLRGC